MTIVRPKCVNYLFTHFSAPFPSSLHLQTLFDPGNVCGPVFLSLKYCMDGSM